MAEAEAVAVLRVGPSSPGGF